VSRKAKLKPRVNTLQVIIRILLFAIVISFLINYLSAGIESGNSHILGTRTFVPSDLPIVKSIVDNLYQQLPPNSRQLIENLVGSSALEFVQSSVDDLRDQTSSFPRRQLEAVKQYLIDRGHDILNNFSSKNE